MNLEELLLTESSSSDEEIVDLRALDYVSSYDDHLMCPICHCAFIRPIRLQCDHIFCQGCLSTAIISSSDRDSFTCPTCRSPTKEVYTDVPRLLINMCDDIRVRCPFSKGGCTEIIPRGHVQLHVDRYCGYKLVDCPNELCEEKTRKMDLDEDQCVHRTRTCLCCNEEIMLKDYEEHEDRLCPGIGIRCEYCDTMTLQSEMQDHIEICPHAILPCAALKYGCPVKAKRTDLATHEQQCPLIAMSPYLEAQNSRLDSLEITTRHLQQRNEIFEDGFSNIRSTLVDSFRTLPRNNNSSSSSSNSNSRNGQAEPSSSPDDQSQDNTSSNATNYLLSVHESLREEVGQLSHAITDLDARASMAIMNECLRIKEDMAHTNAAVNSMRMQVQWLMNPRLHQGQRAVRTNDASDSRTAAAVTPGPSSASGAPSFTESLRPRRLSDSAREGTKL